MRNRTSAPTTPTPLLTEHGVVAFRAAIEARGAVLRINRAGYIEIDYPSNDKHAIETIIEMYENGVR